MHNSITDFRLDHSVPILYIPLLFLLFDCAVNDASTMEHPPTVITSANRQTSPNNATSASLAIFSPSNLAHGVYHISWNLGNTGEHWGTRRVRSWLSYDPKVVGASTPLRRGGWLWLGYRWLQYELTPTGRPQAR